MGTKMASELHPDVWSGQKNLQMTNFSMPNNVSSMKYALKSVSGLADVGVPHGVEDGPRTTPRCVGRVCKKSQISNFGISNNVCMFYEICSTIFFWPC